MDVLEVMKQEAKICNYIDIPLQHIADPILKSMRRGTTKAKTTKLLQEFRQAVPEMAIRTTLIVIQTQTYQNSNKTQTFKVSLDIDGVKVNPKFTVKSKSYGEFGL